MKNSKAVGFFRSRVVIFLGFFLFHEVYAAVSQADYDALIQSTKGDRSNEQLIPAINQLNKWRTADPTDKRIVYDLATLLDKAGDYPTSESYYQQITQNTSPAYAIEAVAHAALKNGHFQKAETAYQLLIKKTPGDINAHVGLVYAWMGQGRIEAAFEYAHRHLPRNEKDYSSKDLPMVVALAELYEKQKEWLQAASIYQKVLQLNPKHRYARRGLVLAMKQQRLFYLAKYYADQFPSEFTQEERYELAHDAGALTIRFGEAQLAYEKSRSRYNTIDIALDENADMSTRFGDLPNTKFDRIIALKDRGYMREALALYLTLVDANIPTPAYVKFAAAECYLFFEQPEKARDVSLQAFKELGEQDPDSYLDRQITLMYAYNEAEQHREAETLSERTLSSIPQIIYKGMGDLEQTNPDYLRAQVVNAQFQTNNDRLNLAENHLNKLRAEAPFNNEIRTSWASLQVAREHPHAALDEYSLMLIDDPTSFDATVGRGETLLSLNEFAQAKSLYSPLPDANTENKAIQNYAEKLANYDAPFYKIESLFGQGQVANGADSLVDAIIYSAPLNISNDHVRLLAHLIHTGGDTVDNGSASRSRFGMGFDYRARDIDVQVEANHTLNNPNNNGITASVGWQMSDAWFGQALVDTNTINLPAKALTDGVTARLLDLSLTWSLNESRKIGGGISGMRFSDDNLRNDARVWWMERWVSGPVFKFDTVLNFATEKNSGLNRPYFNPVRDHELYLDSKAEWLTWRRYRRSFKQRVNLTVGQNWQSGFGSGELGGLRYEHEWQMENETTITYGVGRNFQPYDGVREFRKYFYLNVSGRIK